MRSLTFWHPVGAHSGESLIEIVQRKQQDISKHGFTLWSFAPARMERIELWRLSLKQAGQSSAEIICTGDKTQDPGEARPAIWMTEWSRDGKSWLKIPGERMTSYHRKAGTNGIAASAFFVTAISTPASGRRTDRNTPWLSKDGWSNTPVPTRGEFLVEKPNSDKGQLVRLVLTSADPFVVFVR